MRLQMARLDALLDDAQPLPAALAPEPASPCTLDAHVAIALFRDQLLSRELDAAARVLRARGRGFYTIQSAGHEQNVVLGELLELTDPCLLHYRSGALMLARARRGGVRERVAHVLLSLCASRDDPIAQGRHKVWGSQPLWVVPQTSTIASHVPRSAGLAFAHGRALALGLEVPLPADAVVCCSLGDASLHHASALAGIQAARYAHRRGSPMAILFVCEDNGRGISVETPRRWIEASFGHLPHLAYIRAEGELDQVYAQARAAIDQCRDARAPVLLHLPCVRLFGHAGSDVEFAYREPTAVAADAARDPLMRNARWLLRRGLASRAQLRALVREVRAEVATGVEEVADHGGLRDRDEVMATLAPYDVDACLRAARAFSAGVDREVRMGAFAGALPEAAQAPSRRTLGAHLNAALRDAMLEDPRIWIFGEDVARKGGVYHVTAGLLRDFGSGRVFDTLLDETSILGLALGAGLLDLLPVPEIQYLAYLHNALDQIRGEACSLGFFSSGQFRNPMVVRVAGLAYQKGFGGHFHNDNAIGALRDIPGLMIAAPSRGDDGARLLRGALAVARACGRVVCFLEPIALYHEKDLYEPGDEGWLFDYPRPPELLLPGEVELYGAPHPELLVITYANGVRMALRAARQLERQHGVRVRTLDLRWLAPLPLPAVSDAARGCAAVLVADECRRTGGGVADALVAHLAREGFEGRLGSVASEDSYVPLGPASDHVLLREDQIVAAGLDLLKGARGH